jgi:hypothetical protein
MTRALPELLRPRDLALLLLASRDLLPRQRARDQQADLAGMQLRRQVLEGVVALDPEPNELDAALLRISNEMGKPSGPARALAAQFREEWQAACTTPGLVAHLLGEAVAAHGGRRSG